MIDDYCVGCLDPYVELNNKAKSCSFFIIDALGAILFGTSVSLVFMSFTVRFLSPFVCCSYHLINHRYSIAQSYLVDTYLMYSASAFAANTVCRSAVAAGFPLFTTQMFDQMGVNWACTLIGCVSLALAPSPFLFYKFGPRIRARSRFAPCFVSLLCSLCCFGAELTLLL